MDEAAEIEQMTKEIADALAPIIRRRLETLARGKARELLARVFGQENRPPTRPPAAPAKVALPKKGAPAAKAPAPTGTALKGQLSLENVIATLTGVSDGLLSSHLRKQMGLPNDTKTRKRLNYLLQKAEKDKKVLRRGDRRGARYSLRA